MLSFRHDLDDSNGPDDRDHHVRVPSGAFVEFHQAGFDSCAPSSTSFDDFGTKS